MLRKCVWVPVVAVLALLPTVASAQFQQGDWELTLTGSGNSDKDFDTTALSVGGTIGYFFTDQIEASFRQTVSFFDSDAGGSSIAATSAVGGDFHFDLDRWQPFIGGSIGYTYGDDVEESFFAGPEGGVKYFVNNTTFIFGQIAYLFNFDESDSDFFSYQLGIGFRW